MLRAQESSPTVSFFVEISGVPRRFEPLLPRWKGGNFHEPRLGIPRDCALSPLLAGFRLYELDQDLSRRKQLRYLALWTTWLLLPVRGGN